MKLLKSRKLTKSNCPLFSFFSFVTPRLASYFGKGLNVFIIFSVVLAIVFWCPIKSNALVIYDGSSSNRSFYYSDILTNYSNRGRLEISFSEPIANESPVFDFNHITYFLPNAIEGAGNDTYNPRFGYTPLGYQPYMHTYYPVCQLFTSNQILVTGSNLTQLDCKFVFLRFPYKSPNTASTLTNIPNYEWVANNPSYPDYPTFYRVFRSYMDSNTPNPMCYDSTPSLNVYRTISHSGPVFPYRSSSFSGYCYSDDTATYVCLGPAYQFANVSDISFVAPSGESEDFDDSEFDNECDCHCKNCCDCNCGFYTEQLKEELIDYFETNMVTREMFEEYINTTNNYYESQEEEISSIKDNTEFSSQVDDYYDNADNMFSDINNALDGLDDFESHLTLGSEIQGAGTIINSMFSNFPPSIIVAMVFVLVMLVVVKIIGR